MGQGFWILVEAPVRLDESREKKIPSSLEPRDLGRAKWALRRKSEPQAIQLVHGKSLLEVSVRISMPLCISARSRSPAVNPDKFQVVMAPRHGYPQLVQLVPSSRRGDPRGRTESVPCRHVSIVVFIYKGRRVRDQNSRRFIAKTL